MDKAVISLHSVRPSAKPAAAVRFMLGDRRRVRSTPGVTWSYLGISGLTRRGGIGIPPSPLQRAAIIAWRNAEDLEAFMDGPVARRWDDSGEHWMATASPVAASGPAVGHAFPAMKERPTDPKIPIVVATFVRLRPTQIPGFYGRDAFRAVEGLGEAPGLLWTTGAGEMHIGSTMTFWRSTKDMRAWAYGANVHGTDFSQRPFDRYPDIGFIRAELTGTQGTIGGVDPLASALRPVA